MKTIRHIFIVVAVMVAFVTAGCSGLKVGAPQSGGYTIDRLSARHFRIAWVDVSKGDGEVLITGVVRRVGSRGLSLRYTGYVHMEIIDPEGEKLYETSTLYSPRIVPTMGWRKSYFQVRIPIVPPEKSLIRLSHHRLSSYSSSGADSNQDE